MYKRYVVRLTDEERGRIGTLISRGGTHARSLLYTRILLKTDASEGGPAWADERIADAMETSADTVAKERRRFVEDGLEVARSWPRSPANRGGGCWTAVPRHAWWRWPAPIRRRGGRGKWTLRLLADWMAEPGVVESPISPKSGWSLRGRAPLSCGGWKRPVVCFDERPCQFLADVREPPAPRPGGPGGGARLVDHEHKRGGTADIRATFEPSTGRRRVEVTEKRRKREFAEEVRRLAEEDCPDAEKTRLVLDDLSARTAAAFYEAFPVEQARLLARRVGFCYTPVHGSWLNMAEIGISVPARRCLGKRRLADQGPCVGRRRRGRGSATG